MTTLTSSDAYILYGCPLSVGSPPHLADYEYAHSALLTQCRFLSRRDSLTCPSSAGEVRRLYRAFKQDCPTGIVDEDTFKDVYDKIFPLGDASQYAHLVFLSIDK